MKKTAWNICFIICHQRQTRSGKIKANKAKQNFGQNKVFLLQNWTTTYLTATPSKLFNITFIDTFFFFLKSLTHEKVNRIRIFQTWNWQVIRDWRKIKEKNIIYDVIICNVIGVQQFPVILLREITRNYFTPVTCYHVLSVII